MTDLCLRCDGQMWICADHHGVPWPHQDCGSEGMPCPRCNTSSPPAIPGFTSLITPHLAPVTLLEPGLETRCGQCGRWHPIYSHETRPRADLSGPSKFLWIRCPKHDDGEYFVGSWGTESRHPVRRPSPSGFQKIPQTPS